MWKFVGLPNKFYEIKLNANCKESEKVGGEHPCSGTTEERLEDPDSKFAENLVSTDPGVQKYLDLYNLQSRTIEHTIPMDGLAAWYVEAVGDIFRETAKTSRLKNNNYLLEKINRIKEFKNINPATIRDIVQFKDATDEQLDFFKKRNNLLRSKTNELPDGARKNVMLSALDTIDALTDWCKNPGKEYTFKEIKRFGNKYPEYSKEYTKAKSSIENLIKNVNKL